MEAASITVRVLFFGGARDATGHDEIDIALDSPANTESARSQILSRYPELQRFGKSLLLAVNQEYAQPETAIHDGDELALFPPVSGGNEGTMPASSSNHDFFELTTDAIDVGAT